MKIKTYFVYTYRYVDMRKPKTDATPVECGIDSIPCSVIRLQRIRAKNKKEAILAFIKHNEHIDRIIKKKL